MVHKLVMIRHGESEWNQKNLFCGWVDSGLSAKGLEEAKASGDALKSAGINFDIAFTSVLSRAQVTLDRVMDVIGPIPTVESSWRLNERHYGALTGLNKAETVLKFGEAQVQIWRRSFNVPPPPMEQNHPYYKIIREDPRFSGVREEDWPAFESLELTIKRTLPFWEERIAPAIKAGKRVLIVAHGNSLRGIVKTLDRMSDEAIMELNLPTGMPFVYELDDDLNVTKSMQFLGDPEAVQKAMDAVANQGKAKK